MKQTAETQRLRLRILRLQHRVAALEEETSRQQNQLRSPEAATARLDAARRDALTVHIDMETLERIEKTRLNIIAREIRDRVMRCKPEPDPQPENTEEEDEED